MCAGGAITQVQRCGAIQLGPNPQAEHQRQSTGLNRQDEPRQAEQAGRTQGELSHLALSPSTRVSMCILTPTSRPREDDRSRVRDQRVSVLVRKAERLRWAARAHAECVPLSEWMRSVLNRAARTG